MARNLSAPALNKIAEKLGSEPITIIEVDWIDGDAPLPYADRSVGTIPGKILEVGTLDNVVNVSGNNDSQQLSVTLDDTDGTIKAILDSHDVHQRDVRVYQYFDGLALSDRFLLFRGKISSPVTWSEGDRTVSFDILSQIEDAEIGFSPEEGQFDGIPEDLIGRPWPMVFGTAVHVEGVPLNEPHVGTLATGVGIIDFLLPFRMFALDRIISFIDQQISDWLSANGFSSVSQASNSGDEELQKQLEGFLANKQRFEDSRTDTLLSIVEQGKTIAAPFFASNGFSAITVTPLFDSFRVFGGESFPRGTITLDINGAKFTGAFSGVTDEFVVHSVEHPRKGEPLVTPVADGQLFAGGPFGFSRFIPNGNVIGDTAGYFFAEAGAQVKVASAERQQFVVSITPGTVQGVKAFIQNNGRRFLIDVPEDLYTVKTQSYGAITATIVELSDALSKRTDLNWDDQIFVTFQGSVGPNTVDIMEYLIQQNTDFNIDSTSFNAVRSRLANYPSHFALTDRKQILQALNEIAFQARCAIILKNDTFFLRYLPAEPASADTITESDVNVGSLEIFHTGTEDLVTKFVARWRATGAQERDNKVILRHNVKKYGTKEREFNFYIYNNVDLVIKSATYWLIRMANTWKKVRFSTPLNKLNLETFDAVTLDFNSPLVANADVLSVVEKADYNSGTRQLDFECWTPVKAGTMEPYVFGFPADVDQTLVFPTQPEVNEGFDGGTGIGRNASGVLPARNDARRGVRVNYDGNSDPFGFEAAKRRNSDRGAINPSDTGDQNPGAPAIGAAVLFDERLPGPETPAFDNVGFYQVVEPTRIDIATTKIIDSRNLAGDGNNIATLATFFAEITGGKLKMATDAQIVDANDRQIQSQFDFKYDDDTDKWGAGTAFLQE
ncbi:MAG: hypothetical protein DWQ31_16920 [Planctomycetota bacterium]|nr:MAG: hypothetical protein DWQ31_16920 [Planctomycetota bacterium]REJ92037.1 MAG: hypothetical protein DWQ35_12870 [Planctomycetota bacterium]REK28573.1 MAG: hypothetical protein DWQ42_04460 [Planctomycetota bacterium]REK39188.1 MAG: hypothetical protein DWQ46_18045 [Planctomycetota bacterium]